jgi:hypothetical protein
MLLTSLKDLISKRQQFSRYFERLMNSGTDWIRTSKPRFIREAYEPSPKVSIRQSKKEFLPKKY